jgi:uncharacterized damage-inducible protein DinB
MHPVLALFRRNAWATERLLEFCQGRPEAEARLALAQVASKDGTPR